MKPLVIYHSPCMDGFTAAWACWLAHPEWEFHPGVHGEAPPDATGRVVYLLDFSYKRPVMEKLISQATTVLVLDHHVTAKDDLLPLLEEGYIEGKFDMDKSGARLAWEYFHPGTEVPYFVRIVEDRDLWRFNLSDTRAFCNYVFSFPYDFKEYTGFQYVCENTNILREACRQGEAIERKQQKDIAELTSKLIHTLTVGGVEVPAANLPYQYASDAGHIMSKDAPFAAIYFFDGKHYKFSLRSSDTGADVSEVAKRYGGGGHKHAAGFQVSNLAEL